MTIVFLFPNVVAELLGSHPLYICKDRNQRRGTGAMAVGYVSKMQMQVARMMAQSKLSMISK